MLFFLAQTSFLFALNELVVLKLFFFFFEGSVTDFVENLMNGLSGLFPKKIHIHPKSYSISEGSGPSKAPCLWTAWDSFRPLLLLCARPFVTFPLRPAAQGWDQGRQRSLRPGELASPSLPLPHPWASAFRFLGPGVAAQNKHQECPSGAATFQGIARGAGKNQCLSSLAGLFQG